MNHSSSCLFKTWW